MKRVLSVLIAVLMLVSLLTVDIVHAENVYEEDGQKLDVVLLNDGQYMIKLPGVDYTMARQAPVKPDINPTDNPDDFWPMGIKVDVHDLVIAATDLKKVTVTVTCQKANYSEEFTIEKKDFGKFFEKNVPIEDWNPQIFVKFDDGRDSRYLVEAKNNVTNTTEINIDFLGHTGVATRWFGNSKKPDVKANFLGINRTEHLFDLPKVNQNTVLRSPSNTFEWRGHDNIVLLPIVPEADVRVGEIGSAKKIHLEIQDALQGQLADSKYYFQITGESSHIKALQPLCVKRTQ